MSEADLREIVKQFDRDTFAKSVGLRILEVKPGYARVGGPVGERMLNAAGLTHGAAIFTAADFALAVARNSYGETALATSVTIHFLKTSGPGTVLEATANEENRTRKTGLYRIDVRDAEGRRIALAHGTVHLMGRPFIAREP